MCSSCACAPAPLLPANYDLDSAIIAAQRCTLLKTCPQSLDSALFQALPSASLRQPAEVPSAPLQALLLHSSLTKTNNTLAPAHPSPGIAIGIAVSATYDPESVTSKAVQGTLNGVSGGMLL